MTAGRTDRRFVPPGPPAREPAPFSVETVWDGDECVLTVHGELDFGHAPKLATGVADALRRRPRRLVVDLCSSEFVDSCGLAVLLNAKRRAVRSDVPLVLVCDVPSTLRLLELTRLDRDFEIHRTRPAAETPGTADGIASP